MGHSAAPTSEWASPEAKPAALAPQRPAQDRESTMTVFPGAEPPSKPEWAPALREAKAAALAPKPPAQDRGSTMTVFPKGVPSAYYADRQQPSGPTKPVNSDLGWLNLGLNNNSQTRL